MTDGRTLGVRGGVRMTKVWVGGGDAGNTGEILVLE